MQAHPRCGACVAASLLLLAGIAPRVSAQSGKPRSSTPQRADSTRDTTTVSGAGVTVLAPTVVTGTRERQARTQTSATIDALSGKEISRTRPSHPAQVLNRIAGVHITELSAEGHSTAIRQPLTTKPVYLYLEDGIPTRATGFFNHNALYEVNVPQAGGIEVMKGPGTALYGSDAIGGIVNVLTRPAAARPTLEGSIEGGGGGYARLLTSGSFRTASNALRADLNLTQSQGWRDDTPYHRGSGTIRWDTFTPSGWTARTVGTITSVNQHDPLPLPADQFAARSLANLSPIATRGVRALRISSAIEKEGGPSLLSFTPYFRRDVLDIVPSWQLSYDPQVWDTRNLSFGMLTKYRRDIKPLHARVIVGTDMEYSPGSFFARRANLSTTGGANGVPRAYLGYTDGPVQYDYDVAYRSLSPYVQAEWSPTSRLRFDLGARYDLTGYVYSTNLAPVDTGAHRIAPNMTVSYGHVSPKLGVTFDVTPSLNLYASYRNGFRAPSQSQLFQMNSASNAFDLEPVTVNSLEAGIRGTAGSRVVYELDGYDMRINNDILTYITPINTREASNAGATRHRGIETSVGVQLLPSFRADIAYSVSSQRYVQWSPSSAASYAGKLIEQAPKYLGNLLLSYSPKALNGGRTAIEIVSVGGYYMDPENTHTYGGYTEANLLFDWPVTSKAGLFFRITNLTDRNYAEIATYDVFQKGQYTPAEPRTIRAGARFNWSR